MLDAGLQAALTRALEALDVGDIGLAKEIIADILNAIALSSRGKGDRRCVCGSEFTWPGELEAHQFRCVHARDTGIAA